MCYYKTMSKMQNIGNPSTHVYHKKVRCFQCQNRIHLCQGVDLDEYGKMDEILYCGVCAYLMMDKRIEEAYVEFNSLNNS